MFECPDCGLLFVRDAHGLEHNVSRMVYGQEKKKARRHKDCLASWNDMGFKAPPRPTYPLKTKLMASWA